MKGSGPFGRGGFGCIFKPALRCKNNNKRTDGVSKLLETKYAEIEYNHVHKIKEQLKHLKMLGKYFLLNDVTICDPAPLTPEDLNGFHDYCYRLFEDDPEAKENIKNYDINKNLHKYKIINMPELGMSLNDWIKEEKLTPERLIKLNKYIMQLIQNAIVPMNNNGVVHNDIKSENILFNKNTPSLIDWGLSYTSTPDNKLPKEVFEFDVQWQNPFSTYLFTESLRSNLMELYKEFLIFNENNNISFTKENLRLFAISSFLNYKINKPDQYTFYRNVFLFIYESKLNYLLKNKEINYIVDTVDEQYYMYYMVNYIVDILYEFTDKENKKLMLKEYFTKVYMYNCDIWGIMSIYCILIFMPRESYNVTDKTYINLINSMFSIFTEYIFVNGNEKINISKLLKSIKNINDTILTTKQINMLNTKKIHIINPISKTIRQQNKSNKNMLSVVKLNSKSKKHSYLQHIRPIKSINGTITLRNKKDRYRQNMKNQQIMENNQNIKSIHNTLDLIKAVV